MLAMHILILYHTHVIIDPQKLKQLQQQVENIAN